MSAPESCTVCGRAAARTTVTVLRGEPNLVACERCGLVSLERLPTPDEVGAYYQETYYEAERGARFVFALEKLVVFFRMLRARNILRWQKGPAALLDVGCGRGTLLALLKARGWRVLGTQLSETAARAARSAGVDVVVGELLDVEAAPESFQVVTFYHVLEHLLQPSLYLRRARELLAPGGLLLVEVPNFAAPGFKLLGLRNLCVDHPYHLHFYTPRTLREQLEEEGFEIVKVSFFSLEYSPVTTLQNMLNALPGRPNRLLDALRSTAGSSELRRQPQTWLHLLLGILLAPPAFLVSLLGLVLPVGNTMCFYCRKP